MKQRHPAIACQRLTGDASWLKAIETRIAALRAARERTRVLVASPRARAALGHGVALDALVLSGDDEIELREAAGAQEEAELVVWTEGEHGGRYQQRSGVRGRWAAAAPMSSNQRSSSRV